MFSIRWVRHAFVFMERYWWVTLIPLVLIFGTWAFDRKPPFKIDLYYVPTAVRAGEEVAFLMDVTRDLDRNCDVDISRFVRDSAGFKSEVVRSSVSSAGIKDMDRSMLGQLRFKFPVPPTTPSGPTHLITELAYQCDGNPLHKIWPIRLYLDWPFEVLPPKPAESIVIIQGK